MSDKKFPAIILTFDRNRILTEHMIYQYRRLWPDHPFRFRVPFQEHLGQESDDIEFVRTPSGIVDTITGLLDGISDEDWIYWCIDDKYPVEINLRPVRRVLKTVRQARDTRISGFLMCRRSRLEKRKNLTGKVLYRNRILYVERANYEMIWIHQFVRAKVIRHLVKDFPDQIERAKDMDRMKKEVTKPDGHRLFVTSSSLMSFGESSTRGQITKNCWESLLANGFEIPNWFDAPADRAIVMGAPVSRFRLPLILRRSYWRG